MYPIVNKIHGIKHSKILLLILIFHSILHAYIIKKSETIIKKYLTYSGNTWIIRSPNIATKQYKENPINAL